MRATEILKYFFVHGLFLGVMPLSCIKKHMGKHYIVVGGNFMHLLHCIQMEFQGNPEPWVFNEKRNRR